MRDVLNTLAAYGVLAALLMSLAALGVHALGQLPALVR